MRHCYVLSRCVVSSLRIYPSDGSLCVDFKASGEESKVPLRSNERGATRNAAAQGKEEGWQDGLRLPWPYTGGSPPWQGSPLCLFLPHLYRLYPFPSLLSRLFMFCCLMLRLGVRRVILVVILAENQAAALVWLKEMFGPELAYGCWMAAACTMTVMRRGEWKWGRRGDGHIKVSNAYAWTAPSSCITTTSPCRLTP